ncbi:hypothetical protein QBC46DRAFT_255578 [Diplogelasinospora grovesii]|uniref:Uncharacterized protein n=1 Tax=Diplogelasinospora grovesii TaxID=303347 RepID=A0AAN6NBH7_9PEZI|nr:hypothetical protein QBC46DRAFT_255578 [Diplogelasinospora grovesii]
MATPNGRTNNHNQDDGWVNVTGKFSTKGHTKSRTPQYNGDNESSVQVAGTSSAEVAGMGTQFENISVLHLDDEFDVPELESTTSTSVPSAITLTVVDDDSSVNYTGIVGAATMASHAGMAGLTEAALDQHLRQLNQGFAGDISDWVAGAGLGERFHRHLAPSVPHSMRPAPRSKTSLASSSISGDPDWQMVLPPTTAVDDIFAVGAWCDPTASPAMLASRYLSLDEMPITSAF